jgi:anaerobic selenocysteine-containing dehydrogenase
MSPADAERLGVASGGRVRVTTRRGSTLATVEVNECMQAGHVSLPNGLGLFYLDEAGRSSTASRRTSSRRRRIATGSPARRGTSTCALSWRRWRADDAHRLTRMRRTRFNRWPCPIARATDLIGDWWTPLVLREAFSGRRRFEDFQQSLKVPRAVLAK